MTFDELRAANPGLGFAVYAYDAGGDVTLEVHDGGERFAFTGPTLQAAIDNAFPSVSQAPASSESASLRGGHSSLAPLVEPGEVVGAAKTPCNVFD